MSNVEKAVKGKPALSSSMLRTLRNCGMQYYYRYVEGIIARPGVAMVIGTATHKAIEKNLRAKQETGALLSVEAVEQTAAEALSNTWDGENPVLHDKELIVGEKAARGWATDVAVALSRLHHGALAPAIVPVHLERYWRLDLKGYPMDLDGFIDIQEPTAVRDTKTKTKSPGEDEAERSTQLTAYALAVRTIDGTAPASVHLDFLISTKEPKYLTLTSVRTDDDFRVLLREVETACRVIESGAFMPTDPANWQCSERWCGYFASTCPFGARRRSTNAMVA
jgi:CRISPR/Cas system-associated exonuclease Cas4 (RecB family)